jgi:hypothetical protein
MLTLTHKIKQDEEYTLLHTHDVRILGRVDCTQDVWERGKEGSNGSETKSRNLPCSGRKRNPLLKSLDGEAEMGFRETGCEDVNWIEVAQERHHNVVAGKFEGKITPL